MTMVEPDKRFLTSICKKATSITEAAKMCGFSTATLHRRCLKHGLEDLYESLGRRGRKTASDKGRTARTEKLSKGKKSNRKNSKKSKKKSTSILSQLTEEEASIVRKTPHKKVSRLEEQRILDGEMQNAREALRQTDPGKMDEDEFFSDLAGRLQGLDEDPSAKAVPQITDSLTTTAAQKPNNSKREEYLSTLVRIANILAKECE